MKRLQAYKFQLRPKDGQVTKMQRFAGCCRFVWNKALALEKESFATTGKRLGYNTLAGLLTKWKQEPETSFLTEVHSQILQQSLKDLDRGYVNFFQQRAKPPRFKKRGVHNSFRYPQGFKLDEKNSRIYLPKIGWVRYRNSRSIEGTPKQVTVSLYAGKWFVSVQTEREIENPVHPSASVVGIDMGITNFVTMSDGTALASVNSFRKHQRKLAKLQRSLSRKTKFSANWYKAKARISRIQKKITDVRKDFLHKATTPISKNHAIVVVEDLKVKNMSASASGNMDNPGHNVRAKSGLNKAILDQGWYEFRRQLGYKLAWQGGTLLVVPPQYTSQTCSQCDYIDRANRPTQARFKCIACGFETNADHNAALNILAAGQAVSACGVEKALASTMKQEPTCRSLERAI